MHFRLLAAALALLVQNAWAAPSDDIRKLMDSGRVADAYAFGRDNPDALGDPTFDFYFGIAAIDSGNSGEGVLALERYLLAFPDNISARLHLARGYFNLGEDARAREEFEEIQRLNPPADVSATIQRFLDAIRLRESRYQTSAGAYVEFGLGTDSNVNGGVANANLTLPNLGPVIVGNAGTRDGDRFTHLGVGGYVTHPLAPGISLFGTGSAELKLNGTTTAFDQGTYGLAGGASYLQEKHLFRAGVSHNLIAIENDRYRAQNAISGEWNYQLDERQSFNLGAQNGRIRYPGLNNPRDANFWSVGAGYRRLFSYRWQPIVSIALNQGEEETLAPGREDLARKYFGGRGGVSFTPAPKWGVALGYAWQQSRYQAPDLILGVARSDNYAAWDASVSYLITSKLSVRGEVLLAQNHSNIALYTFPREIYSIKLRYEFK